MNAGYRARSWSANLQDNADAGAAILSNWLDLVNGDVTFALGACYQDWPRVVVQGPLQETRDYVGNVLALVPRFES